MSKVKVKPLSPAYIRMIRDDFMTLLHSSTARSKFPYATDAQLALDLRDLNGLMGEW